MSSKGIEEEVIEQVVHSHSTSENSKQNFPTEQQIKNNFIQEIMEYLGYFFKKIRRSFDSNKMFEDLSLTKEAKKNNEETMRILKEERRNFLKYISIHFKVF